MVVGSVEGVWSRPSASRVPYPTPFFFSFWFSPFRPFLLAKCYIARSALSWSTKRTVLTQEVLRVLLNCSKLLPWERVVENVNEMVLRMRAVLGIHREIQV